MTSLDELFGSPSPLQRLADEQVSEDRDMLRDLVLLRKRLRLSQAEVGERLGVSGAAIQQFERLGGDPRLSTIRRYALALGALIRHDLVEDAHEAEGRQASALAQVGRRTGGRMMSNAEWRQEVSSFARSASTDQKRTANH